MTRVGPPDPIRDALDLIARAHNASDREELRHLLDAAGALVTNARIELEASEQSVAARELTLEESTIIRRHLKGRRKLIERIVGELNEIRRRL